MSVLSFLCELRWRAEETGHSDRFFIQATGDSLPPDLAGKLTGMGEGGRVSVVLQPGASIPERVPEQVLETEPSRFIGPAFDGRPIQPRLGRFYPKGLLSGSRDATPCRCIRVAPERLAFDCNHPLAGRRVECIVTCLGSSDVHAWDSGAVPWTTILEGPGMQARDRGMETDFFSDDPFQRLDESEDSSFYASPRLVEHVDTGAREIIRGLYGRLLGKGWSVLDLMSSHQSHLAHGQDLGEVTGLGLNMEELDSNPLLTDRVVQDLNREPVLPFKDQRFDAALCSLSVEYLTRPLEVFAEAARVIRPGGLFVCTFSNRWFPKKAIRLWTQLHEFERIGLVAEYFLRTSPFDQVGTFSERGWPRRPDPYDRYYGRIRHTDPVYGVWAKKGKG
jgi:SAM-dependent methyltransferase/FKBP-type peptidyl-prolyl cis-trans isomerase 2